MVFCRSVNTNLRERVVDIPFFPRRGRQLWTAKGYRFALATGRSELKNEFEQSLREKQADRCCNRQSPAVFPMPEAYANTPGVLCWASNASFYMAQATPG